MQTQHTPGPWKQNVRPDHSMEIQAAAGFPIAVMTMAAHRQANARLIASAPDLLEALKSCVQFIDAHANVLEVANGSPITCAARATIAMAERGAL